MTNVFAPRTDANIGFAPARSTGRTSGGAGDVFSLVGGALGQALDQYADQKNRNAQIERDNQATIRKQAEEEAASSLLVNLDEAAQIRTSNPVQSRQMANSVIMSYQNAGYEITTQLKRDIEARFGISVDELTFDPEQARIDAITSEPLYQATYAELMRSGSVTEDEAHQIAVQNYETALIRDQKLEQIEKAGLEGWENGGRETWTADLNATLTSVDQVAAQAMSGDPLAKADVENLKNVAEVYKADLKSTIPSYLSDSERTNIEQDIDRRIDARVGQLEAMSEDDDIRRAINDYVEANPDVSRQAALDALFEEQGGLTSGVGGGTPSIAQKKEYLEEVLELNISGVRTAPTEALINHMRFGSPIPPGGLAEPVTLETQEQAQSAISANVKASTNFTSEELKNPDNAAAYAAHVAQSWAAQKDSITEGFGYLTSEEFIGLYGSPEAFRRKTEVIFDHSPELYEAMVRDVRTMSESIATQIEGEAEGLIEKGIRLKGRKFPLELIDGQLYVPLSAAPEEDRRRRFNPLSEFTETDKGYLVPRGLFTDEDRKGNPRSTKTDNIYNMLDTVSTMRQYGAKIDVEDILSGKAEGDDVPTPQGSGESVPNPFLEIIDRTEGGGDYNTLFGFSNKSGRQYAGVNVSDMTISELNTFAKSGYGEWVKGELAKSGQEARIATPMGRYQFVNTTLQAQAKEMGLSPDTVFTPEVQDAMFNHYMTKRLSGKSSMAAKRAAARGGWEGFKHVSDAELDAAIIAFENGESFTSVMSGSEFQTRASNEAMYEGGAPSETIFAERPQAPSVQSEVSQPTFTSVRNEEGLQGVSQASQSALNLVDQAEDKQRREAQPERPKSPKADVSPRVQEQIRALLGDDETNLEELKKFLEEIEGES